LALAQTGPLLRYACENVPDIRADVLLTIAQARQACETHAWSPTVSQRFWSAFNELCALVKPVTIDGLTTLHRSSPRKRWLVFWGLPVDESLAERTNRRYTAGLLFVLGVIIILQLITWTYTNLAAQIDKEAATVSVDANTLRDACDGLTAMASTGKGALPTAAAPGASTAAPSSAIAVAVATQKRDKDKLDGNGSRLWESANFLSGILLTGHLERLMMPAADAKASTCTDASLVALSTANYAHAVADRARLTAGILLQFVLPVLLGAIGALAYVMRNTSEQIRSSTFLTTTPSRNLVRIVLGALMGVIVGLFTDLSTKVDLQPLAISFLAGYGVEPFFSLFDAIIARLK
jgi:hypothetical protein